MALRFIKSIAAALLILALIYLVDMYELWQALSQISWQSFTYLLLISFLLIYISALKWGCFLEALGARVSAIRLFNLYLMGYFVNFFVPSYVGGDAMRSWYLGTVVGQHQAFAATILERYTGLVAMVLMAFGCMWFGTLVPLALKLAVVGMMVALVVITALALSPKLLQRVASIHKLKGVAAHLSKVQTALTIGLKNPGALTRAMLLSFLYHGFTILNTVAAAWAVGWYDPPVGELFVVVPLILLVGAIPLTPSNLGIQEGAFLFFLKGVGATSAEALGVGLVLRAKTVVLALLGGIALLRIKRGWATHGVVH